MGPQIALWLVSATVVWLMLCIFFHRLEAKLVEHGVVPRAMSELGPRLDEATEKELSKMVTGDDRPPPELTQEEHIRMVRQGLDEVTAYFAKKIVLTPEPGFSPADIEIVSRRLRLLREAVQALALGTPIVREPGE